MKTALETRTPALMWLTVWRKRHRKY